MQRPKKEQGRETREEIIEVTTRLFATRGYAGTSLDLIAKEANTSKSSIFWHFENKEDLLFTVVDRAMGQWEAEAGTQILAESTPRAQLERIVDLYRELAMKRPDTLRLLLGLLLETVDVNEKVKQRFQKMYRGYRASIQLVVEEGVSSGAFSKRFPPAQLAAMTLALFDGLFIQWFLEPTQIGPETFVHLKAAIFDLVEDR